MFVLRGTVVTMRPEGQVLSGGAVYVGDDGLIAAVTPLDAVPPGFLRLSVGCEDAHDLVADLRAALDTCLITLA